MNPRLTGGYGLRGHRLPGGPLHLDHLVNPDFTGPQHPHQAILKAFHEEERKFFKRRHHVEVPLQTGLISTKDNAHNELKLPILLAQVVSLFPISGVTASEPSMLRFRWFSVKMFYSLYVIVFEVWLLVLTVLRFGREGVTYRSLGDLLFYTGSMAVSVMFVRLAHSWKDFVIEWVAVQESMTDLQPYSSRRLINVVVVWLFISSISEHLLSNTETILSFGPNDPDKLERFMRTRQMQVYHFYEYRPFFAFIVYITNFIVTMVWNYMDIFLTAISLSLARMFKQFSRDLKITFASVTPETSLSYWKKRREIYSKLSILTKLVDEKVSLFVVFSFGINVYYICVQLLQTIQPMNNFNEIIYFGGSFGHLICRTCAVSFAASSIYENSRQPLSILFAVPSDQFNIEVQRLQMQVSSETLALTGCNFFAVTRSLMLTIAGTIVTYEIVLWQLNPTSAPHPTSGNCTTS